VEHPDAHTFGGLIRERLGEPLSGGVVLEDVVVEMDPSLCPRDGREPVVVGVRTVLEQLELVTFSEWRAAGAPGPCPDGLRAISMCLPARGEKLWCGPSNP
jgi:hypothetical protein